MESKINIGVVLSTRIGTNTSLLEDEFKFFNVFKKVNPDVDFYFIPMSDFYFKDVINKKNLLDFDFGVIRNGWKDHSFLDNMSGIFTYMTSNNFFGGVANNNFVNQYCVESAATNRGIPLFIRTPDSEYNWVDYRKMTVIRVKPKDGQPIGESAKNFYERNKETFDKFKTHKFINYDNVYWVANGSDLICDWVDDVVFHNVDESLRVANLGQLVNHKLYVSDDVIFTYNLRKKQNSDIVIKEASNKNIVFIGYLKGSVQSERIKVLNKMFNDTTPVSLEIYGPGADQLEKIKNKSVKLHNHGIYGKDVMRFLNDSLAYMFIGKGNPVNKYINKTIYDCAIAKTPVIVYRPCDSTHLIFKNDDYYFDDLNQLNDITKKLKVHSFREKWILQQREEIENKLESMFRPMFKFHDYCKSKPKPECTWVSTGGLF